jgi:hypothetical protein
VSRFLVRRSQAASASTNQSTPESDYHRQVCQSHNYINSAFPSSSCSPSHLELTSSTLLYSSRSILLETYTLVFIRNPIKYEGSTRTMTKPSTCCGRGDGCVCAATAKCSCGQQSAMNCTCERKASENTVAGPRCSCSMISPHPNFLIALLIPSYRSSSGWRMHM